MTNRWMGLVAMALMVTMDSCGPAIKEKSMIAKDLYGRLPDGRVIDQYTLTNKSGAQLKVITFGATVTSLTMPDRNGTWADIVLGYDSLQNYVADKAYFGIIAGRYANRIEQGKFSVDGTHFQLSINDGENHLHGGKGGFGKVVWSATERMDSAGPSVVLTYVSPDGEEGYPGTVTLAVAYTLTHANELRIEYTGTADRPTILNPTHHSYFNLSGSFSNTILDHRLMIRASRFTPVDAGLITTGELAGVAATPMDFQTSVAIGAHIDDTTEQLQFGNGYDHNWVLDGYDGCVHTAAELYEPTSGRHMTVLTDQPGLQFYSGNFLNGTSHGKGGTFAYRTGLCLEAQRFPDSPNKPDFPSAVLRPGETYHQLTVYQFSVK